MSPTLKDVHSQLQTALGNILELQQEVHLLKSSNKNLTEQIRNLLKLIGDFGVDDEWGTSLTEAMTEIGNHVGCMEIQLELWVITLSTFTERKKCWKRVLLVPTFAPSILHLNSVHSTSQLNLWKLIL